MPRKLIKDVSGFTGSGVTLGIGTGVVAGIGGSGAAAVLPAFATAGRGMGMVGTAMMGKHALRQVKKIKY